jgi:excisionase family DNA binding protein
MGGIHPQPKNNNTMTTRAEDHPRHRVIEPKYYRPLQAANYLQVGKSTIYLLIKTGEIPSSRIRGAVVMKIADLDAYVANNIVAR